MIGSLLSGNFDLTSFIITLLMRIPAVLIAISVHEAAHGYASYKLGDPTAKLMGRVTINPFAHFDWFGIVFMLLFGFGWAKPVPFDLRMLKRPKRDTALIAVAGPLANLLTALVVAGIWIGSVYAMATFVPNVMSQEKSLYGILVQMLQIIVSLNLGLMIFNLIPVPPLDGSKVLISFLPASAHRFVLAYERYGMPAMMIWILVSDRLPWFLSIDFLLSRSVGYVFGLVANFWIYIFDYIFNLIV